MTREPEPAPDATAQVRGLEELRWAALVNADMATLEQLFSPGLAYTHSNAMFDSKASYLKPIADGEVRYNAVRRFDEDVRIHAATAVVTGRAEMDVTARGTQLHPAMRYSAVWAFQAGRWRFVCWHSTPLPGG
jgi:hypothetical protein